MGGGILRVRREENPFFNRQVDPQPLLPGGYWRWRLASPCTPEAWTPTL